MKEIDFDKLELDEYEQDIVDNLENMKSVDNLEETKEMLIQATKNTIRKRGELEKITQYSNEREKAIKTFQEIAKNDDFNNFIERIHKKGLSIEETLKVLFHQLATGEMNIKISH